MCGKAMPESAEWLERLSGFAPLLYGGLRHSHNVIHSDECKSVFALAWAHGVNYEGPTSNQKNLLDRIEDR